MTRGWSLKVRPLLEEAADAAAGAGTWTAAVVGSEGADIVGAGGGRGGRRDLGSAGGDCDGDGQDARWGWGFCAVGVVVAFWRA